MNVTSLRYQPVEGGALGGHFALHVVLGEAVLPEFSPTELATKIHDAFESLSIKAKAIRGVLIDCRRSAPIAEEMLALLGTLRDWGIHIVLWVGESIRYPWFEFASYITVFVTRKSWPNFRVNEIRYVMPVAKSEWVEPEVYDVNANAACYIVLPGPRDASLVAFVTECNRPWGVVGKTTSVDFKLQ